MLYPRISIALRGLEDRYERLRELVEDPDADPSLAKELERRGLMLWLSTAALGYRPTLCREIGIGREWAWQIPIYREIVKQILTR